MVLQVLILLAVSLLGSTVLPTLANGVVRLVLFGLAWLGGSSPSSPRSPPGNELMANLGTADEPALPADAVWRGGLPRAAAQLLVASSFTNDNVGMPFASTQPAGPGHAGLGARLPGGLPQPGRRRPAGTSDNKGPAGKGARSSDRHRQGSTVDALQRARGRRG